MLNPLRPLSRSVRHFSSPAPASSYPYNPSAIPRPSTTALPPPPALVHPRNGWSLITHLNNAASHSPWAHLFARRSRDRLPAGSVLTVITYTDPAKKSISPFSGVLMGTKRRGVDTSFRLRNIVNKAGVEMTFKLNSPMIKDIKVVKRAEKAKGQLKDLKRAKVNYLRERPAVMAAIARALKTAKQNEAAGES
ncbi:ribosomal protein L19 [Cryptococcus gattii Ru294]|uniref:50s ribosomal protein l19, putative n=2 Tax=Cryptococcus gattii TaxID=37769 RepID=E6REC7_CRYGW|nr:50s ribosomal protein l19, putative [Cryptococcus gattii WM276]KIR52337.1 ribosomal protein L19 [Cryptococcus gattii Ru294]KIR76486.1 ribosomal protein L19 [Cryptococcus gattii EJB2]KIY32069.1 ribosomal protein L19 [Cryptococcus gattii E566]KJE02460.1 ribosomal protein L19 [Cryptococcus gattii NT-10]ADV25357.1 50s ribosomal protein l19, putative [Cryptococcus gattii WM276]